MLQLQHIRKAYTTGDFTQTALNDVSVSFRDNEFVAILGPSGSGKTTLLNIIGGLDHYDSGNLVVDGISTESYKDRDWDAYRNNRIGFVFQSYNLIPHQTVLANVELALTLSGVSRDERRRRAEEALAAVGLADHVNKKPSQLSGGQMQRVAIARALINDPEILLADEPTGALDSKTSVQIMDLLTEIARDRLVIMVTHNPELAEQYATRIVNLADGVIRSDTDPYEPTPDEMRLSEKPVRRTSMGFLTALSLSFNNLMTKKGRTIMTAFAGSIGIIGIAAILSLANGVNAYIKSVEEDTLSVYPLQIMSTGFDMTSMVVGSAAGGDDGSGSSSASSSGNNGASLGKDEAEDASIGENPMITRMLSSIASNDLASLKAYFDSGESGIESFANSVDYTYNVTPQIFDANTENGVRQINPDTTFAALGMGSGAYTNSLMSMTASTDMFAEMVGNPRIVEEQYNVVAGHWPEKYNECVLVLTPGGNISDFLSYVLGLRDSAELKTMVNQFMAEEQIEVSLEDIDITYDDILNKRFKLVNAADFYQHDEEHNVWVDKSDDKEYMANLVNTGEDLVIAGIVKAKPEAKATALSMGVYYTPELTRHLIEQAAGTQIVKDQLAHPEIDVISGKTFAELEEGKGDSTLDMNTMFTVDEGAISSAFSIDPSKLAFDMTALQNAMAAPSLPGMPPADPNAFAIEGAPQVNSDALAGATAKLTADYTAKLPGIIADLTAKDPAFDITTEAGQQAAMAAYLKLPETEKLMNSLMPEVIDTQAMQAELAAKVQAYMTQTTSAYIAQVVQVMQAQMSSALAQATSQLSANMASAMSIDPNMFANAFKFNLTEQQLTELIMSTMRSEEASYDGNLSKFGYADLAKPAGIDIYPIDFDSKQEIVNILDDYNQRMIDEGHDERAITYTDIVGTLMSSVTTIIDMISYVLIAFVAISLVVSSIMIGVITYISVLERKKEIGILRAIGASKGDVSRVFNAETVIEGLVAGILGVGVTALCCVPISAIVYAIFDVPNVAQLPPVAAAVLVLISVLLTFLAGLMPASSASRKDPVEALRSE